LNWRQYEEHRAAICKTFLWGVLILGSYGVYQYLSPPIWDSYWLEKVVAEGSESFGRPAPFRVRVWSTLNSPGPFATVMMAGLLVLFAVRSSWKLPAAVAGYLSFLLSLVRATWLSWFVGLFMLLKRSKPRVIARVLVLIIVLGVCLVPLVSDPRVANAVGDRVNTFSDIGHDESFGSRIDMYRMLLNQSAQNSAGFGLSNEVRWHNTAIDSGIISMLFSLGWLGTLLFAAGIAYVLGRCSQRLEVQDEFALVGQSIMTALLAQSLSGPVFVGVNGILFWMFAGMNLSSHALSVRSSE
jgi:hypothetical protein